MLEITIQPIEQWDEINECFISSLDKEYTLQLEHSLVSLSKWEAKWNKPFLSDKEKTNEETIDYVKCMTLTENVPDIVYSYLTSSHFNQISSYINASMTATWFSEDKDKTKKNKKRSQETVTSELIYYWMIALTIPSEYQHWHLNRLLTLIRVCNVKNEPPKKMSKRDIMSRNRALNEARRKQFNSKG